MAKLVNRIKLLTFISTPLQLKKSNRGFAVASDSHAAKLLPANAPRFGLAEPEPPRRHKRYTRPLPTIMKKTFFLSTILLFISVSQIYACSCAESSIKKAFRNSDIIFTGKVVDINEKIMTDSIPLDNGEFYSREYKHVEFKFKIISLIKGEKLTEFITVTTSGNEAACGNYFDLHSEHLVYSYLDNFNSESYLTTSICTRTKELNRTDKKEILKLKRLSRRKK